MAEAGAPAPDLILQVIWVLPGSRHVLAPNTPALQIRHTHTPHSMGGGIYCK